MGWQEDLRASYLLSAQGIKKKPQEIFPSLSAIYSTRNSSNNIDPNFYQMLLKARDGDEDWNPTLE